MRIANRQQVAGGWQVTIEHEAAFTDGASRFEQVFIATDKVARKSVEQIRQALQDALADPFEAVEGADVAAPIADTKAIHEDRAHETVSDWQEWQWRIDHVADYPGYAALTAQQKTGLVTVLTNRRNAAAARDWDVLQAWRNA